MRKKRREIFVLGIIQIVSYWKQCAVGLAYVLNRNIFSLRLQGCLVKMEAEAFYTKQMNSFFFLF